jgi:glycogen synthase
MPVPASIETLPGAPLSTGSQSHCGSVMAAQTTVLFLYPGEFLGPETIIFGQILRHLSGRFRPLLAINSDAAGALEPGRAIVLRIRFGRSLHSTFWGGTLSMLSLPLHALRLGLAARAAGVRIVHTSATARSALLGFLVARVAGARLLVHFHVIPGRYGGLRGIVERAVAHRAEAGVAVSQFVARRVLEGGFMRRPAAVVPNGVDLERFTPAGDGNAVRTDLGLVRSDMVVLQLARLIPMKRQDVVIRAVARARQRHPELRCLLVGWEDPRYDGPFRSFRDELEHLRDEEGLGNALVIAAARPDAPSVIAAADIVVMASEGDAWNLTVTEAMATAKPVVVAASGGMVEQVVDGVTGLLFPPGDVDALAARLEQLSADPSLRRRLGAAGREHVEREFGEARVASGVAAVYDELLRRA